MYIQDRSVPVVAVDGPAGVGKGTARHNLAKALGFHELDSGCLYRAVALESRASHFDIDNVGVLVSIAKELDIRVEGMSVYSGRSEITKFIRSEEIGNLAKVIAQIKQVREALLSFQLSMRKLPGLVADGRDMGYIFENPLCFRYFLFAQPEEVARRRVAQMEKMGQKVDFSRVLWDIMERDREDQTREVSPLRQHPEAVLVDTTDRTPEETAGFILSDFNLRYTEAFK